MKSYEKVNLRANEFEEEVEVELYLEAVIEWRSARLKQALLHSMTASYANIKEYFLLGFSTF